MNGKDVIMMRDRLIELILQTETFTADEAEYARKQAEYKADHLLANGVIVPPCKVGDKVYEIVHGEVSETEAVGFLVCQDGAILLITSHFFPISREIGCSVFLTREEAEQKLRERKD